jgi:hypothetical protein
LAAFLFHLVLRREGKTFCCSSRLFSLLQIPSVSFLCFSSFPYSLSASFRFQELIPEFYCLPEFLMNSNRFDMGVKQDGTRVNHVILPPWARGSPRLFMKKHREALESKQISDQLHSWIDLIFGYKQQGEAAKKAFNVFHPLTYEGAVDIESITGEREETFFLFF